MSFLGAVTVAVPLALVAVLGLSSLVERPLGERAASRLVQWSMIVGLLASAGVLALMLSLGTRHVPLHFGNWVEIPHFHFSVKFVFDRLSVPFVLLTFLLSGIIAAFASRYLHREPGFNRFFVLLAVFVLG